MAPDVLVHSDHGDAVKPGGVIDQDPSALGQDRVIGGVPGHSQSLGQPGDSQVLGHQGHQRPPHRCTRQLRPPVRRRSGVLAPHPPARLTAEATHPDQQRGGPPPERLMRQLPGHRAPRGALGPAVPAERVVIARDHPAFQHRPVRLHALANRNEAKLVQAGEGRQIRGIKGKFTHVEVFWSGRCRNPHHQGTSTPTSTRSHHHCYTLRSEEPLCRLFGVERGCLGVEV